MKTCIKCNETKEVIEFHLKRGKPQAQCKTCRAQYMKTLYQNNVDVEKQKRKTWYEANKEKVLAKMKADRVENKDEINLKRRLQKYGLTMQQHIDILAEQDSKCANKLCVSKITDLDIDHCHKSGEVRGYLCGHCNTAIGLVKESTESLKGLIDYLNKCKK